jgi:DNA ligase-1
MLKKYLLGKSSTGKFRYAVVECSEEWEDTGYVIQRSYGQVRGKNTLSPAIVVSQTKQKRNWKEQYTLQFNSEVKKFLDKGYKEVEKHPNEYTDEELNEIYGDVKTRGDGIIKPMLAKQADKVSAKTFDKDYYGSRKVNGVRCLIYYKDGKIQTASRGAVNYNIAIIHIIQHPLVEEFFKNHPEAILDGEIFKMGYTLNKISGICRSQSTVNDGKDLEFYWYDIVDLEKPFTERYKLMQEWSKELQLSEFDPYRHYSEDILHIQFLPQVEITGYDNMKKLHDSYVAEGWEGLVIRLASSTYKPGARGNDWIKIKCYFDDTYKVIGYELGLRGSEDMVFICEMKDGKTFKASPMGSREIKQEYVDNFEEKYKNQLGDCKYFEISPYGIPQQPKFIAFRWDLN